MNRQDGIGLVAGSATALIGLALLVFGGDITVPVVTVSTLGVVLVALGAIEVLAVLRGLALRRWRRSGQPG